MTLYRSQTGSDNYGKGRKKKYNGEKFVLVHLNRCTNTGTFTPKASIFCLTSFQMVAPHYDLLTLYLIFLRKNGGLVGSVVQRSDPFSFTTVL